MQEFKEQDSNLKPDNHRAYNKLMKETGGRASNLEIVEASTEDLRERQYWAEIKSGSSEAEACAVSGWRQPNKLRTFPG
jgi:hypothetical protein